MTIDASCRFADGISKCSWMLGLDYRRIIGEFANEEACNCSLRQTGGTRRP